MTPSTSLRTGLLLASKSAARRAMLAAAGIAFETVDAPLDEQAAKAGFMASGLTPREMAAALADAKARSAAAADAVLVLGADQILELDDGAMLGKPRSRDDALMQLRRLGGRTHHLHSAAALIRGGRAIWTGSESVALTMRPLGEDFLQAYLDAEYDAIRFCVGGYRIEGPGAQLFERIEGSHFAILGLPLLPLLAALRAEGLLPG